MDEYVFERESKWLLQLVYQTIKSFAQVHE